jgi:hypothetical protein
MQDDVFWLRKHGYAELLQANMIKSEYPASDSKKLDYLKPLNRGMLKLIDLKMQKTKEWRDIIFIQTEGIHQHSISTSNTALQVIEANDTPHDDNIMPLLGEDDDNIVIEPDVGLAVQPEEEDDDEEEEDDGDGVDDNGNEEEESESSALDIDGIPI